MSIEDIQQKLLAIIEHAQTAKLTEFRLLRSWSEYRSYKNKYRSFRSLVKVLKRSASNLLKRYCISVTNGTADFTQLVAYQQLISVLEFYEQEVATYNEMLEEYEHYLFFGNFLWAFLGFIRPDLDLIDYRHKD